MNDSFNWQKTAGDLLSTGLSYFQKPAVQPKPQAPVQKPADTYWIKWAIGGGAALLVVVVVMFSLRGKR